MSLKCSWFLFQCFSLNEIIIKFIRYFFVKSEQIFPSSNETHDHPGNSILIVEFFINFHESVHIELTICSDLLDLHRPVKICLTFLPSLERSRSSESRFSLQ